MTKDQLEEARRIELFALASKDRAEDFRTATEQYPLFVKNGKTSNCLSLARNGCDLPLTATARPEVYSAWAACKALMQQALDAEADRWAKAFDDFEVTK